MMMRKMFSQLKPMFTISQVKSLNSICHVFYNLDLQQYLQCCQGILRYRWIAQTITNCTTNIDSIYSIEIYIYIYSATKLLSTLIAQKPRSKQKYVIFDKNFSLCCVEKQKMDLFDASLILTYVCCEFDSMQSSISSFDVSLIPGKV